MHYIWWVPTVVIWYTIYYFFTVKNNSDVGVWYQSKWFWCTWCMGLCPLWAIVSRVSHRIVFDGLLYDCLLVLIFPIAMILYNQATNFTTGNYAGVLMVVVGMILIKL